MRQRYHKLTSRYGAARTTAVSLCTELPGNARAAAAARSRLRTALADWGGPGTPEDLAVDERLADDAVLLLSELVTNAVIHAGTAVKVACRLDGGTQGEPWVLVVEVSDYHPSRLVQKRPVAGGAHGLHLVSVLAESWGVTYQGRSKIVWFRLPLTGGHDRTAEPAAPQPAPCGAESAGTPALSPAEPEWNTRGALGFLAEASGLLAGQTDEDNVASLAAQLVVPRLADWCAVWREGDTTGCPQLTRVWHSSEERIDGLRTALLEEPPHGRVPRRGTAVPWPWPGGAAAYGPGGAAVACRLTAGERTVGTLLMGRAGLLRLPEEVMVLIEDFARRVGLAMVAARRYTRQATISKVLQRGLLPSEMPRVPGVDTAVVYEPAGEGTWAGGDFYDVFDAGAGRWCFALGDVCGSGPEAAVVTGRVRPVLRALAREGHGVAAVLDRLNREVGEQERFLSLLFGELVPTGHGTVRCALASAGHPLPLKRDMAGVVTEAARPQLLLGVLEDTAYREESFELGVGETLLCVTDGVTEHRSGKRQFDDGDRLAALLADCADLSATAIAERVRRAVHAFDLAPPVDDLALLVVQPTPERDS